MWTELWHSKYWYSPIAVLALIIMCAGGYAVYLSYKPHGTDTFNKSYGLVLKDYDGKDVHLYEFRRKVLIAYAWATWCPYCSAELQNLSEMKKKYGDDVQIVAINRAETVVVAKPFTDKLGISNILFLIDPEDAFFKSISGYAMPETVFINERGEIVFHQRGPLNLPELEQRIHELGV